MGNILVIAVNEALANNVANSLLQLGHAVQVAASAAEAMRIAVSFPFHAALLDRAMPGTGRRALIDQLMNMRPESTYVLMSGETDHAAFAEAAAPHTHSVLYAPSRRGDGHQALPFHFPLANDRLRTQPTAAAPRETVAAPALASHSGAALAPQPRAEARELALSRVCVTFQGIAASAALVRTAHHRVAALDALASGSLHVLLMRDEETQKVIARVRLYAPDQRRSVTACAKMPMPALMRALDQLEIECAPALRLRHLH